MLEIHIPDEMFSNLNIASEQHEKFVLEAVKEKIARENKRTLRTLLVEGYAATRGEDAVLTEEFEAADFENL